MSQPLISIIIPIYNVEGYLPKCINSVIGQSYRNIEIILVDDGSLDRCSEICNTYAKRDPRIKVIHQTNSGVSEARNAALDTAEGEYILFVDSDDWIENDTCEKAIDFALNQNSDIVIFGIRIVWNSGRKNYFKSDKSECITTSTAIGHIINYTGGVGNYTWNKLYKHSLFQGIRYPKGKLYEDNATTYKLLHKAERIYITDIVLYNYLRREGSISFERYIPQALMDRLVIWEERLCFLKEYYPEHVNAQAALMVGEMLYGKIILKKTDIYNALCQFINVFFDEYQPNIRLLSRYNKKVWLYYHSRIGFHLYARFFAGRNNKIISICKRYLMKS